MASRERLRDLGLRRGLRLSHELRQAGVEARLRLGLTQSAVAAALGISRSKLARWEREEPPHPSLRDAAAWLSVLGVDLALNTYPAGAPLRDIAHLRVVNRFLKVIPPTVARRLEAPIPRPGDLRAWDVLLAVGGVKVGVAVETRLRDWQDLLRREQRKARDTPVDRLLLVLADTRWNRRAVEDAGEALLAELPLEGRAIRAALQRGRDPGQSGLLFL